MIQSIGHIAYSSEYRPILSGLSSKNSMLLVGHYKSNTPGRCGLLSPARNVLFQRRSRKHIKLRTTNNNNHCVWLISVWFYISAEAFRSHWMNIQREYLTPVPLACVISRYNFQYLKWSVSLTSQPYTYTCAHALHARTHSHTHTTNTGTGLQR